MSSSAHLQLEIETEYVHINVEENFQTIHNYCQWVSLHGDEVSIYPCLPVYLRGQSPVPREGGVKG